MPGLNDWIDVFDCSENKKKNVTPEDLKTAAKNYDPNVFHSPVTTDHKEDGPAYGRIKQVKAEGNKFFVKLESVGRQLVDWLKNDQYKNRSMEFYKNLNGKGFYPRALSFVQFPECKSQEPILLSENLEIEKQSGILRFSENENLENTVFPEGEFLYYEEGSIGTISYLIERIGRMFQKIREKFIVADGIEKTDEVLSLYDIDSLKSAGEMLSGSQTSLKFEENKEANVDPKEIEKIKQQVRDEEALKFQEKNKDLLKFKETTVKKGYSDKFDLLLSKGKVSPKHKEGFIAFMEKIDGDVIKFSETECDAVKFFEDLMNDIPENSVVDLSNEQKYKKDKAKDSKGVLNFSDIEENELHEKTLKFSETHNISYEDALLKVI
ncbi:MAG: hypothetical protein JXB50_02185 [Spirochaetes bacterium]|nr:hypothetical protein [Spirochaetota bacterium]